MKISFLSFKIRVSIVITCFFLGLFFSTSLSAKEPQNESLQIKSSSKEFTIIVDNKNIKQEDAVKYYNLAKNAERKGNNIEAIKNYQLAGELFEKNSDTNNYIITQLSLSQLCLKMGLIDRVEPILSKMLILAQKENLTEEIAITRGLLGNLNLRLNRPERAIEQYKSSLEIKPITTTLISLSQAYHKKAQNLNKNIEVSQNTREIEQLKIEVKNDLEKGQEIGLEAVKLASTKYEKITSLLSLIKLYNERINLNDFSLYKSEVISLSNSLPEESFKASKLIDIANLSSNFEAKNFLQQAEEIAIKIGDRYTEALAKENLGKNYLRDDDYEKAKYYTEQAILISQTLPSPKRLFYQYEQLGKIELLSGNSKDVIDDFSTAFSYLRPSRGEFSLAPNLLFELQDDAKIFLREYISLLFASKETERAIEALSTLKLVEFQEYYKDPCIELAVNDSIEPSQSKKEAIIYSFIDSSKTYLIAKLPNGKTIVRTSPIDATELNDLIVKYRIQLTRSFNREFSSSSRQIYDLLIKPLEQDLDGIKQITFINDDILRNISMDSFNDGSRYLIEKYAIDYGSGVSRTQENKIPKSVRALVGGATNFRLEYDRLPSVKEEVEFLAAELKNAVILFEGNFTQINLEKAIQNQEYYLIHLATHGFFGGNAENSYLLTYKERIALDQLNNIFLETSRPTYLLVLSACETATGSTLAPLGISGTALKTGTRNVLATLWNVQDNEAKAFIQDFYIELSRGKTIPEARQAAILKRIANNAHPKYWSAFVNFSNANF